MTVITGGWQNYEENIRNIEDDEEDTRRTTDTVKGEGLIDWNQATRFRGVVWPSRALSFPFCLRCPGRRARLQQDHQLQLHTLPYTRRICNDATRLLAVARVVRIIP